MKTVLKIQKYRCTLRRDGVLRVADSACSSQSQAERIAFAWFDERRPPHEELIAILLSGANQVLGIVVVSQGGAHGCAITPCDVFRPALAAGASAVVLAHNHPSGCPRPSREDILTTQHAIEAGKLLGICMFDHLVVARGPDNKWRSESVLEVVRNG